MQFKTMIDLTASFNYDNAMYLKEILRKRDFTLKIRKAKLDWDEKNLELPMPPLPKFERPKRKKLTKAQVWGFICQFNP